MGTKSCVFGLQRIRANKPGLCVLLAPLLYTRATIVWIPISLLVQELMSDASTTATASTTSVGGQRGGDPNRSVTPSPLSGLETLLSQLSIIGDHEQSQVGDVMECIILDEAVDSWHALAEYGPWYQLTNNIVDCKRAYEFVRQQRQDRRLSSSIRSCLWSLRNDPQCDMQYLNVITNEPVEQFRTTTRAFFLGAVYFRHQGIRKRTTVPPRVYLTPRSSVEDDHRVHIFWSASGSGKSVELAGSAFTRHAHGTILPDFDTAEETIRTRAHPFEQGSQNHYQERNYAARQALTTGMLDVLVVHQEDFVQLLRTACCAEEPPESGHWN